MNTTEDWDLDLFVLDCGLYTMCVAVFNTITVIKMIPST